MRELSEELEISAELKEVCRFYVSGDGRGTNRNHMFCLFKCNAPENWKFSVTEEVQVLIPMGLVDITKQMKSNPEKFTLGFLNSMANYIKTEKLNL